MIYGNILLCLCLSKYFLLALFHSEWQWFGPVAQLHKYAVPLPVFQYTRVIKWKGCVPVCTAVSFRGEVCRSILLLMSSEKLWRWYEMSVLQFSNSVSPKKNQGFFFNVAFFFFFKVATYIPFKLCYQVIKLLLLRTQSKRLRTMIQIWILCLFHWKSSWPFIGLNIPYAFLVTALYFFLYAM